MTTEWSDFLSHKETLSSEQDLQAAGYVAVHQDSLVKLSGPDAAKLLQGQITADVDKLQPGSSTQAALCTNKGRVVATFSLFRDSEDFYCRLPCDNAENLIQTLRKYAVFYKVEISEVSNLAILVLFGKGELDDSVRPLARMPHTDQAVEYWIEKDQGPALIQALGPLSRLPENRWQQLKIKIAFADIHKETSEVFLPHALSLDLAGAISFEKGCYTGQEIVARTHYRGKSKKRLARLLLKNISQLPGKGSDIFNSGRQNIGNLIVAVEVAEGVEALVSVNTDISETGVLVIADNQVSYQILILPWQG